MRIPLSWLKEYLDLSLPPEEIAEALTLAGIEVDAIEEKFLTSDQIVVAEIQKLDNHPNADRLKVAEVFDGKELLPIVCAATNCQVGKKTALAKIGACLLSENGVQHKIKKTKLRGIDSYGMLCSEKVLSLSENNAGIMEIDPTIPAGTPLNSLFGETIFEISLTPNLGHCMSVLGIARQLSAILSLPFPSRSFSLQEKGAVIDKELTVDIQEKEGVPLYGCRLIRNSKVGPSPHWLKQRLLNAGIRSVNNIVDATNYILLDSGQPLHAFDYDLLPNKTITAKQTKSSFPFETLDHLTRQIPEGTLMIYANNDPIDIAGVMGGLATEVTSTTKHILLEAALFDPSLVRRASKMLGIRSEASARFERGIDPEGVFDALDYAAHLIAEVSGGEIAKGKIAKAAHPYKPRTIPCRVAKINQVLGTTLSMSEVETIFQRLNMKLTLLKEEEGFTVTIPSYRNDLALEIDLIEEVACLFGYNNIPRNRARYSSSTLPHSPIFLLENQLRKKCLGEGLQEFITCNLISPKEQKRFVENSLPEQDTIAVLQPSSQEQSTLRSSLLPGLLQSLKHNFSRKEFSISSFEIGRIHFREKGQYRERTVAAIILTGKRSPSHWQTKPKEVDFYDIKGIVENILAGFYLPNPSFTPSSLSSFHPGNQASFRIGSITIGSVGEVSPLKLLELDVKQPVFFAEIDLVDLLESIPSSKQMEALPLYPGSERDWTIAIEKELPADTILKAVTSIRSKLLKKVTVLDLYEGEKAPKGKKNLTLRFVYRSDTETVEQGQVDKEHKRMQESVLSSLSNG